MNLYCIKYSMLTKNRNIKIKRKIVAKINLYSRCVDCSFRKFETTDKKEMSDLLKVLAIYETMLSYCLKCRKKKQKVKNQGL